MQLSGRGKTVPARPSIAWDPEANKEFASHRETKRLPRKRIVEDLLIDFSSKKSLGDDDDVIAEKTEINGLTFFLAMSRSMVRVLGIDSTVFGGNPFQLRSWRLFPFPIRNFSVRLTQHARDDMDQLSLKTSEFEDIRLAIQTIVRLVSNLVKLDEASNVIMRGNARGFSFHLVFGIRDVAILGISRSGWNGLTLGKYFRVNRLI